MHPRSVFRSSALCLALCLSIACLAGCQKRYVGEQLNYKSKSVCKASSFPVSCEQETQHFTFEYTVSELDSETYKVEGYARHKDLGPFRHVISGTFNLLLSNEGTINDNRILKLPLTNLGVPMPFSLEFTPEQKFDATRITYDLKTAG